jgi:cell division protein FtsL
MNNVTNLVKKYRQAAWRVQRQWLALILLGVALAALVAGIYLNVTARGTLAGRQVLNLEAEISDNKLANADLETKLAEASSTEKMEQHAQALGFHPATADEITYVVVPGYVPQTEINLATTDPQPIVSSIRPEYTQTLFEWFAERIQLAGASTGGQP